MGPDRAAMEGRANFAGTSGGSQSAALVRKRLPSSSRRKRFKAGGAKSGCVDARLWLGTQGWHYKDWVGNFYPHGTQAKDMLTEYGRALSTTEVDSTYYATPPARTVEGWRRRSPALFRFGLKTPSEITHVRRFRDADAPFAEFVERARLLGDKLGAILVQCPPDFDPTPENHRALFHFMAHRLPADCAIALELRDARWYEDDLFALARRHGFAIAVTEGTYAPLALADLIASELERDPPAPFAYLRWLGDRSLTAFDRVQIERTASLDIWERLIRRLRRTVRDIYGYVNNHYQGHSPATVRSLAARLGEEIPPESTAPRLF